MIFSLFLISKFSKICKSLCEKLEPISEAYKLIVKTVINKKNILKYKESLKAAQYLLIVNGSPEEVERARGILESSDAVETAVYAEATVVEA